MIEDDDGSFSTGLSCLNSEPKQRASAADGMRASAIFFWRTRMNFGGFSRVIYFFTTKKKTLRFFTSTMAAPPSKPSPSNQSVQKTTDDVVEASANPVTENPLAMKSPEEEVTSIQAYENSESSELYKLAKHLLGQGDFETALTSIEKGIESVKDSQHESAMAPVSFFGDTAIVNRKLYTLFR